MGQTAAAPMKNHHLQLDLPPTLYGWLTGEAARRSVTVDQIVRLALERYVAKEKTAFDITRTRTWQLCGALEVAEPDPQYVIGRDEQGKEITNYAEHVDDLLYRGT